MQETQEQLKVTAYYERKVTAGPPEYGHEVFGVYVPVPLEPNATDVDRVAAGDQAFLEARAIVQGAIDGTPPPAVATAPAPQPNVAAPQPVAAVPDNVVTAFPGAAAVPVGPSAEHVQYLLDNGLEAQITESYYDNRADVARGYREYNGQQTPVAANAPHFKDKATKQVAIWPLNGTNPPRYA